MQKPMFDGLPNSVSTTAAMPTASPAATTNQLTFFIALPLSLKISPCVILIIEQRAGIFQQFFDESEYFLVGSRSQRAAMARERSVHVGLGIGVTQ